MVWPVRVIGNTNFRDGLVESGRPTAADTYSD